MKWDVGRKRLNAMIAGRRSEVDEAEDEMCSKLSISQNS